MECDQDKVKYDKDDDEQDEKDENEGEPGRRKGKCYLLTKDMEGRGKREKGEQVEEIQLEQLQSQSHKKLQNLARSKNEKKFLTVLKICQYFQTNNNKNKTHYKFVSH